ncbi:MAG: hypothetical protein Q9181_002947 [Wetmoreana brouardii]
MKIFHLAFHLLVLNQLVAGAPAADLDMLQARWEPSPAPNVGKDKSPAPNVGKDKSPAPNVGKDKSSDPY